MKKLLAVALAFSFCTADAGLWQKFKNKVQQVKGTVQEKINPTKQPDAIDNWLTGVQNILATMIADVQAISTSVSSWDTQSNVGNLNTLLNACMQDPFKIIKSEENISKYIQSLQDQKVNVEQLSTDHSKLTEIITTYKTTYGNNLNSMITNVKNIQNGWQQNPDVKNIADQLFSLLEVCNADSEKVGDNLQTIQQNIAQLSAVFGSNHVFVTPLNNGVTYLQTHLELIQRSQALSSASRDASAATTNATSNKLSTAMNVFNAIQQLRGANNTAAVNTGTANTATNNANKYQNLLNTGINLYNAQNARNASSGATATNTGAASTTTNTSTNTSGQSGNLLNKGLQAIGTAVKNNVNQ